MIYIFGASGHANIILHTLMDNGAIGNSYNSLDWSFADSPVRDYFFVDVRKDYDKRIIQEGFEYSKGDCFYCGIGNDKIRQKIMEKYKDAYWPALVSKRATVHRNVILSDGCQILTNACVLSGAKIGKGTIINTGAQVDHDGEIGDFSHIAPNATLCGNVKVGNHTLVGAGLTVYPNITIGNNCCLTTDKTIYRNVEDGTLMKFRI